MPWEFSVETGKFCWAWCILNKNCRRGEVKWDKCDGVLGSPLWAELQGETLAGKNGKRRECLLLLVSDLRFPDERVSCRNNFLRHYFLHRSWQKTQNNNNNKKTGLEANKLSAQFFPWHTPVFISVPVYLLRCSGYTGTTGVEDSHPAQVNRFTVDAITTPEKKCIIIMKVP